MGGGVSLGAFSGGALAEILRQVLYPEAERVLGGGAREFDSIEIDVFMGASAGSLTLAMMLRGLCYSFPEEGQAEGDAVFGKAETAFNAIFGEGAFARLRGLPEGGELAGALIGAARVEVLQERAWVREVSIANLCRDPKPGTGAGLFDSRFLGELGARLLGLRTGSDGTTVWRENRDAGQRTLLADRVIFGSTITPMHPLDHPAARNHLPSVSPDGAYDAGDRVIHALLNRGDHRDARLFDIRFAGGEADGDPAEWVRVRSGPGETGETTYRLDLDSPGTWQEILRTSLASGAVPLAFTPVTLNRHRCELGNRFPANLTPRGKFVAIPYVDGGMFNNEPVEETTRLCGFLDESDPDPATLERVVFFVDSDFPAQREVRRFSYQKSVTTEAEIRRRRAGPNARTTSPIDRSVKFQANEPVDGVIGVGSWSLGALYGHARVTRKTPVLPQDFVSEDPEFLEKVLAVGPLQKHREKDFLVPADLRGAPLSAFAGFLLETWRRHDFARGRCSVYDTLRYGSERAKGLARALQWADQGGRFRPADPLDVSKLSPADEAKRGEAIALLADHIDAHLKDFMGLFRHLLNVALPFMGVPGWEELIERGLEPEPGGTPFELVLPGHGWKLRVPGLEDSKGFESEGMPGEDQTVFGLVMRGGPDRAVDPDAPENFEIHTPWIKDGSKKAGSVHRKSDPHSPVELGDPPVDLRQKLREMLLHGAIGLRLDVSGPAPRWCLYQPPNPIDIGFRQVS